MQVACWDLAASNQRLASSRLFRCSAVGIEQLPNSCTLIDLRTPEEREGTIPDRFGPVIHLPLRLAAKGTQALSRMEASYLSWVDEGGRLFPCILAVACQARQVSLNCVQGIDRTGFVSAVLHCLLGTARVHVLAEYLKVGDSNTKAHHLQLCLEEFDRRGGVESWLRQNGCPTELITRFRLRFLR